jgi:hypothetical protein
MAKHKLGLRSLFDTASSLIVEPYGGHIWNDSAASYSIFCDMPPTASVLFQK